VARHFEGLTHQHGSVRQGEFAVTTAGGGSLTWEMTSSPLSPLPDGRGLAITLALDVTERKRYENALAHAKLEAERANRAKSRFLAAASHDLRQPLQGMQLYFGILSRRVPEDDSAMKGAMQCSEILKTQLDDLMDVAKLDSGATVPELGDCAIGGIIDKVAGGLKAGAEAKGLRLEVGDVDYTVRTDPVLFERLLLNVVSNAIKYTEKGCVLITCKRRAAKLVLQVWDSGIGIPAESRPHIFEEFFQVANSSRDRSKGSGLGLAIVSRIARMLSVRIRVLSRLGRGSVFLVEFPAG
jgi:signal transduction histidine kinase